MSERYYIGTKDLGRGSTLLGVLERIDGDIIFTYAPQAPYAVGLPVLPIRSEPYVGADVLKSIVSCFVPAPDHELFEEFCAQDGVATDVSQWELFNAHWQYWRKAVPHKRSPLEDGTWTMVLYDKRSDLNAD